MISKRINMSKYTGVTLVMLSLLVAQIKSGDPFFTQLPSTAAHLIEGTASRTRFLSEIVSIGMTGDVRNYVVCPRSKFFSPDDITFVFEFKINASDELVDGKDINFGSDGNAPGGGEGISFGVGHNTADAEDAIAGYGLAFEGIGKGVNTAGDLSETSITTTLFDSDSHPYVQAARSLGPDSIGAAFGYQSPGVVQTYNEPAEDILKNLAGNAFDSMDVVASKNVNNWHLFYVVDKAGHFRIININALATGNIKQPKPYVIDEGQILTAVEQNSPLYDYFLIGHGSGTKSFTLLNINSGIVQAYPSENNGDSYEIRVLLGKIIHVKLSTDLYIAFTHPRGNDNFDEMEGDAQPKINLVRANSEEFTLAEITPALTSGLIDGETMSNMMIYQAAESNGTINLKLITSGNKGDSGYALSVRIFFFNVNPAAEGECHSSCSTCIMPGEDKCLTCPDGEVSKTDYTSEGTCSAASGGGDGPPPVFECNSTAIPNCLQCFSPSTATCKKCEEGFGLNNNPLVGGDACLPCSDPKCLVCNKENAGSSCQVCREELKVSLRTGLCRGQLLKFMSMLIFLAFWFFKK